MVLERTGLGVKAIIAKGIGLASLFKICQDARFGLAEPQLQQQPILEKRLEGKREGVEKWHLGLRRLAAGSQELPRE